MKIKKILSLILVISIILITCNFGYAQYTITAEEVEITASGEIRHFTPIDTLKTDIIIPSKLNGVTVKSIARYAFDKNNLTSIVFPTTLISIGDQAFEYNNIKNVIIPSSVRSLGRYVFSGNPLKSFKIEENSEIEKIGPVYSSREDILEYWILPKTLKNKKVAYFEEVSSFETDSIKTFALGDTIRYENNSNLAAVVTLFTQSIVLDESKYINISEKMYVLNGFSTVFTWPINPIIYKSMDENIATISNDTVFLHNLGEVDITANQKGGGEFAQSEEVTQHLYVRNITGIKKQPLTESNVNIYPNPVRNSFTLDMGEIEKIGYQGHIINTGGSIMGGIDQGQTPTQEINISHYPSGMYFVVLTNGKEKIIKKLIKE